MPRTGRYVRTRDALGRTYYRDRVGGGFVPKATWERERNVRAHPPPFPVGVEVPGIPRGYGGGGGGRSGGGGGGGGSGSSGISYDDPDDYDEPDDDWTAVDGEDDTGG